MAYSAQYGRLDYGNAVTPMAFDIAALEHLYGPAEDKNSGDTIYHLRDAGTFALDLDALDGNIDIGRAFYCVVDTSGSDTVNYNGSMNVVLNLMSATLTATMNDELLALQQQLDRFQNLMVHDEQVERQEYPEDVLRQFYDPDYHAGGFFSQIVKSDGTVESGGYSIAHGVSIERADGGSGNDLIIGNALDNYILGREGDDNIFGGAGADGLYGQENDDFLDGGDGNNRLYGDPGDDILIAYSGFDRLDGGEGHDHIEGGDETGSWTDSGGTVWRGDAIYARGGNDFIYAEGGNDTIRGGSSTSLSLEDDDLIDAGAGDDEAFGWIGNDTIIGGTGNDTLRGEGDDDVLLGDENDDYLVGSTGNDTLHGGAGNDFLSGGEDDDWLLAEGGNDTILGGAGDDSVVGGSGSDVFRIDVSSTSASVFVYRENYDEETGTYYGDPVMFEVSSSFGVDLVDIDVEFFKYTNKTIDTSVYW